MKIKLLLLTVIVWGMNCSAQDIHFSQYDQTPQLINPATTGVFYGKWRTFLNHKSQWLPVGAPFQTTGGSAELSLFRNKWQGAFLGLGLNVFNDIAGDSKFGLLNVNLSVAGVVPLNANNYLSVGLQGGVGQRSGHIDNLVFENQFVGTAGFDPTIPSGEVNSLTSFLYPDMAAGIFWQYMDDGNNISGWNVVKFNFGVSYYHILKPQLKYIDASSERLEPKLIFHAGMQKDFTSSKASIVPSVLFAKQGPHHELNLTVLIKITFKDGTKYTGFFQETALYIGSGLRLHDAIIPQVRFQVSNFTVGVSYDMTNSGIAEVAAAAGGIEVSLGYADFDRAIQKKTAKGKGKRNKY